MIHSVYPDSIADQGKNLTRDRFYHGLLPSLHSTLSFAMADLPEREQKNTSFDTLYMLAKKLEARQSSNSQKAGSGPTHANRDRYQQRYPAPMGRVATLKEEELFPPDLEVWGIEAPDAELHEFDKIEVVGHADDAGPEPLPAEGTKMLHVWHY